MRGNEMKEISPINFFKLYQKSKNLRIIDVRDAYDFEHYHLESTTNIPLNLLCTKYYLFLNKEYCYYLICEDGEKSKKATVYLDKLGYQVINVLGGLNRWASSYHIVRVY